VAATRESLSKDHAEEATATMLDLADEIERAKRDILHFTRARFSQLNNSVQANAKRLDKAIRASESEGRPDGSAA
jgi:hypothetical protein